MNRRSTILGLSTASIAMLLLGFLVGFYYATGTLPMYTTKPMAVLPPDYQANVTLNTVSDAIAQDTTNEQPYREGYNCVDYAWDTMRALSWQGIPCYIAAIEYEDGTKHAVIAVLTDDEGMAWFDPQTDEQVTITEGILYNNKRVDKVSIMTIEWIPINEFANFLEEQGNGS